MTLSLLYFSMDEVEEYGSDAEGCLLTKVLETADLFSRLGIRGVANEWLVQQKWKRSLAMMMFGDLIGGSDSTMRVLEVGGSLSYCTLELAQKYDYLLLEKATLEPEVHYRRLEKYLGKSFVVLGDWNDFVLNEGLDLVIANDLFPNVDQRLYEFVDRFLLATKELRMSLTYYDNTSFEVQRVQSGERLIMRPWGIREVRHFVDYLVDEYQGWCTGYDPEQLAGFDAADSVAANRRNIIYMRLLKDD